jgi:hypothetical protein
VPPPASGRASCSPSSWPPGPRLGDRLRAALAGGDDLGVNLLVRAEPGGPAGLPASEGGRLSALPGVALVVPWVELGEATVAGSSRPLLATHPGALALHRGWQLAGRWPVAGEALAGAATAAAPGAIVSTPVGDVRIVGVLRTGEALDRALVLDLAALPASEQVAQRFEVRADPRRVEETAGAAMRAVAGAEARPLLRVTTTRARLVSRLSWILAGAGALTALLALGTLAAASLAQLHARRRELALLFALGYTRAWVTRLLALELLVAGGTAWLAGTLAGGLLGAGFARHLLGSFAATGTTGWMAGAGAALVGAAVVLATTVATAARRLAALEPAAVLAGR